MTRRRASFAAVLLGLLTIATLQLTHVSNVKAGPQETGRGVSATEQRLAAPPRAGVDRRGKVASLALRRERQVDASVGPVPDGSRVVPNLAAPAFTLYSQARRDRMRECRYANLQGNQSMNSREAHLTVECAVRRMPVPGGVARANCIIERESGWYEKARNPTSSASGFMQVVSGTWRSWTQHFAAWRHHHAISAAVLGGRANLLVGLRAASMWGWAPWGGAC